MKQIYCFLIFVMSSAALFLQSNVVEISHYLFPGFTKGVILLKGGTTYERLMNYNSLTEEMVFEDNGKRSALAETFLDQVDTVFVGNRKFILHKGHFIELIRHSAFDLFVEHKCRVNSPGKPAGYGGTSQTAAITSYSSLYSEGRFYELKLPEGYVVKPYLNYWLSRKGDFGFFASMKQLSNLYPGKKELFKAFVKQHEVEYGNPEQVLELIEYLESN